MWLGRDPAIIRDPACIAYLIYTALASKQDPALIWTRLINGHIRYVYIYIYIFQAIRCAVNVLNVSMCLNIHPM